jgi:hypothetical protein
MHHEDTEHSDSNHRDNNHGYSNRVPRLVNRAGDYVHLDFSPDHRQPSAVRVLLATVLSVGCSLLADVIIVAIGEAIFPSTKGYGHFQFSDYGKLTVVGVVIACVGWPVVTRVTSAPRWLFLRLAVAVTLVLWLPDLYILYRGQPSRAVGVLMVLHLAIALVTYNVLVNVAPVRSAPHAAADRPIGT